MQASITIFPGPLSNATTSSNSPPAGIAVIFAIPPRFSSTRPRVFDRNMHQSSIGTSGAPCPPAARSAGLKSLTTGQRIRSATTAASPICHVDRPVPRAS
jgi:hypothetical protein